MIEGQSYSEFEAIPALRWTLVQSEGPVRSGLRPTRLMFPMVDRPRGDGGLGPAPLAPQGITLASLADRTLDGDRVATSHLLAFTRTIVLRYCRGRLGRDGGSYARADTVAFDVVRSVLLGLAESIDRGQPFLAYVYKTVARAVDRDQLAFQHPGDGIHHMARVVAVLPTVQRETVVLRTVVGLSRHHTADALGLSVRAIDQAEQRALASLRVASHR